MRLPEPERTELEDLMRRGFDDAGWQVPERQTDAERKPTATSTARLVKTGEQERAAS